MRASVPSRWTAMTPFAMLLTMCRKKRSSGPFARRVPADAFERVGWSAIWCTSRRLPGDRRGKPCARAYGMDRRKKDLWDQPVAAMRRDQPAQAYNEIVIG